MFNRLLGRSRRDRSGQVSAPATPDVPASVRIADGDLALKFRSGLPNSIAYLRSHYPAAGWRDHPDFGRLAAFWLETHDVLRSHGRELQQSVNAFRENSSDPRAFRTHFIPRINQFLQHLNGHHRIEDHTYFPRFRALDRRMVAGFDLLEADHRVIHGALLRTGASAQTLIKAVSRSPVSARYEADAYATEADRLLDLLLRHLADEEDLIVPAMLRHGEQRIG